MAGIDSLGAGIGYQGLARDYSGYDLGLKNLAQRERQMGAAKKAKEDDEENAWVKSLSVDTNLWHPMFVPEVSKVTLGAMQKYNKVRQENPAMARAMRGQISTELGLTLAGLRNSNEIAKKLHADLNKKKEEGKAYTPQDLEVKGILDSKKWEDIGDQVLADPFGVYRFDGKNKTISYNDPGNESIGSVFEKDFDKYALPVGTLEVNDEIYDILNIPKMSDVAKMKKTNPDLAINAFEDIYEAIKKSQPGVYLNSLQKYQKEILPLIPPGVTNIPQFLNENPQVSEKVDEIIKQIEYNKLTPKKAKGTKPEDVRLYMGKIASDIKPDGNVFIDGGFKTTTKSVSKDKQDDGLKTVKKSRAYKYEVDKRVRGNEKREDVEAELDSYWKGLFGVDRDKFKIGDADGKDEKYDLNDFEPEPHAINAKIRVSELWKKLHPEDAGKEFTDQNIVGVNGITLKKPVKIKIAESKDVVNIGKGTTPSKQVGVKDIHIGKVGIYPVYEVNDPSAKDYNMNGTVLTDKQVEEFSKTEVGKDGKVSNFKRSRIKYVPMVVGAYTEEVEKNIDPNDPNALAQMFTKQGKETNSVMIPLKTVENSVVKRDGNKKIVSGIPADEYYKKAEEMNNQFHSGSQTRQTQAESAALTSTQQQALQAFEAQFKRKPTEKERQGILTKYK